MRDMCLNLDRLVVEEREPGIAVEVVAIVDRGTILAHSTAFTYVAQTKILAGNNCNQ